MLARARAGARVDHQQRHVGVGDSCSRLVANRARQRVLVGEIDATGVDQREVRPFHSQSSSLRSRVIPGRSCTIASREPVSRLTSEDLPTLG